MAKDNLCVDNSEGYGKSIDDQCSRHEGLPPVC